MTKYWINRAFSLLDHTLGNVEAERIEACYQHAIIQYLSSGSMNNTSLRERFKMSERQRSQVSLVIKNTLEAGKIKLKDPDSNSTKFVEYIPYWG